MNRGLSIERPHLRVSAPFWSAEEFYAYQAALLSGNWKNEKEVIQTEAAIAEQLTIPESWVICTNSATTALGLSFWLENFTSHITCCPLTYPATYAWAMNYKVFVDWKDCSLSNGMPTASTHVATELWGQRFRGKCIILDASHRALCIDHKDRLTTGECRYVVYSFGPTKEICAPNGGAVISHTFESEAVRERCKHWLQSGQGRATPWEGGCRGYMDGPSAAVIRAQLANHAERKKRRQFLLDAYKEMLPKEFELLTTSETASGHLCVVRVPGDREGLKALLYPYETSVHYPVSNLIQCLNAKKLSEQILTLPLNLYVTESDVEKVAGRCERLLSTSSVLSARSVGKPQSSTSRSTTPKETAANTEDRGRAEGLTVT